MGRFRGFRGATDSVIGASCRPRYSPPRSKGVAMAMRAWLIAVLLAGPLTAQAQGKFEFVALGDMPYRIPDDYPKFDRLIAAINAAKPVFSIHVGDIKSGGSPCTDDNFRKVFDQFATFE